MFSKSLRFVYSHVFWGFQSRLVIVVAVLILLVAVMLIGSAGGSAGGATCPSC